MLKKTFVLFKSSIACHYILVEVGSCGLCFHASECALFPVREHSEHRCSLVFACIVGFFRERGRSSALEDFAIETALKMADSLISTLTTEQGS